MKGSTRQLYKRTPASRFINCPHQKTVGQNTILRVLSGLAALIAVVVPGWQLALAAPLFPPEFELSSLTPANGGDGTNGVQIKGTFEFGKLGYAVSGAGDVNGDGMDDFVISAPYATPDVTSGAGQSYVIFGRPDGFGAEFEIINLLTSKMGEGTHGFALNGIGATEHSGWSVSTPLDVNCDGYADVGVSAFEASPPGRTQGGRTYIVFGKDSGFAAETELSDLLAVNGGDGTSGFVLNGQWGFDRSGFSIASAGDLNADGCEDLAIGAPGAVAQRGRVFVVFGQPSGFAAEFELSDLHPDNGGDGSEGFILEGVSSASDAGESVSGIGDFNGDKIDDLLIGAGRASPGGLVSAGQAYVYFGKPAGYAALFHLTDLLAANGGAGTDGIAINGLEAIGFVGAAVSGAGDVNGDGRKDIVLGAKWVDSNEIADSGQAYLVFGQNGFNFAEINLADLLGINGGDGSTGVIFNGVAAADLMGHAVSGSFDINGDNLDDFLLTAWFADPGVLGGEGQSYVIYGKQTGYPAEISLSSLLSANGGDGTTGFAINGIDNGDVSGSSAGHAGDVNNDGISDILIGANGAVPNGLVFGGESYVIFGRRDSDSDGVADNEDNCTIVANEDQRDTDGDGYGNLCDPDLDNNGVVNFLDYVILTNAFSSTPGSPNWNPDADLNGDDAVNFLDFSLYAPFFLGQPGPSGTAP